MYPTLGPGTPLPFSPGRPPSIHMSPEFTFLRPTKQFSNVVLPHPLDPNNPYLTTIKLEWFPGFKSHLHAPLSNVQR